jgi:beta-ureidopropionase / N-carbamoyl-L-amino-acid hydrolase
MHPYVVGDEMGSLTINASRFQDDFETLAKIGSTNDGGVHRPTFSEAHRMARTWFLERASAAGLQSQVDGAGNHSAILRCGPTGGHTLLLGSHLDSVPHGGRFDGALGVLAALEVLRVVQENSLSLRFDLEAIDFTDEEGTLSGLLGSSAAAGILTQHELENPRGGRAALLGGLKLAGLNESGLLKASRNPSRLAGYLELHIEQGNRLEAEGVDIGIVTGIVGLVSITLTFIGRADHAGTTAMESRRDAAQGACSFTVKARELLIEDFPGCVANVGSLQLLPGAYNIIPGTAVLSLEFRAPDPERLNGLETALLELARDEAARFDLVLHIAPKGKHAPTPMNSSIQKAFQKSAEKLGLKYMLMASGAGHDAQTMAGVCPAGMIFVPSIGGASHSPRELTRWTDCIQGANTLLQTVLEFGR